MTMGMSKMYRQLLCSYLLLVLPCDVYGGEISVSPPEVIIDRSVRNKEFIEIVNHSGDEYIYRAGIVSGGSPSSIIGNISTNRYIVYPPVGIVKSEGKVQLGVIALSGAQETEDYIYIHFAPKKKNSFSLYEIPINLTMQIKVKGRWLH